MPIHAELIDCGTLRGRRMPRSIRSGLYIDLVLNSGESILRGCHGYSNHPSYL